ncbi:MAG: hypothetical protein IJH25_08525 [Clostridia bacterium]|nr:hypothetical protein [Clostridia bacterium]MBQ6121533.1 hypothetical protein [Clostridia bacterium]
MSRLLEIIGLHVLTNREAIMEELDGLSDEQFAKGLADLAEIAGSMDTAWLHEVCKTERFLPEEEKHESL